MNKKTLNDIFAPLIRKRKKPFAANAASVKHLRDRNWLAEVVEKRLPKCFITKDVFEFIDIIAIDALHGSDHKGVMAVQSTTNANAAARKTKILALPAAKSWLLCGNRIMIHSWAKRGAAGKRKVWDLRVVEITLEDFAS